MLKPKPKTKAVKLRQILSDNPVAKEVYESLKTYDPKGAQRYLKLLYTQHNRPIAGRPRKQ